MDGCNVVVSLRSSEEPTAAEEEVTTVNVYSRNVHVYGGRCVAKEEDRAKKDRRRRRLVGMTREDEITDEVYTVDMVNLGQKLFDLGEYVNDILTSVLRLYKFLKKKTDKNTTVVFYGMFW